MDQGDDAETQSPHITATQYSLLLIRKRVCEHPGGMSTSTEGPSTRLPLLVVVAEPQQFSEWFFSNPGSKTVGLAQVPTETQVGIAGQEL